MNSRKCLALLLVPLGILVIFIVLNQTGRAPGKAGRVAAAEAGENPTPEPDSHKAMPVGQKSLVAKQPKPAAPAPVTRRQPPNGRRSGDRVRFLTEPVKGDPLDIALNYVRTPENRPGYTEEDFKNPKISSRYVSKHNGVTHLYLRQRHEGIEVYGGDIGVNLMPDGSIINLHNAFVTDLASEVNRTDPVLTAQEAIRSAAAFYEVDEIEPLTPLAVSEPDPVAKKQLFSPAGISLDPIPVKLNYVPLEEGVTRLAWNTVIRFKDGERWLDLNVDAETGEVLSEANWIACVKCEAHGLEIGEAHDCGEQTAGMASETSSVTGTNYNVFPLPLESPSDGGRSVLIDPQNTAASPFGWHDTNGAAGAEFTDTRGNNVNAQEDADNNNTGGVRPSGGASLNFNFPLDLTQAPSTYTPAVTANLFYWNNIMHDVFWHYGFDEPAGNFQENNYGNGGAASDPVEADSQDGSGTNNANFGTPPDGSNPRMQMYIWTQANPDRDSSLDNGVIIHEYGHGISNRLTGGPANASALSTNQSRGMGEGWSDFLALALTHQAGDTGAMGRGIGTYVLGQPPTGAGIRPYRYSTDLAVNPQHYGNLNGGGLSVPHGIGSVWCTTLWELYWALVGVHGYNSDIYNGTGGNNIALQLVIDGMKLQPVNPSFLDARDAILTADQVNNGGANFDTIWAAFAKRGMGFSAYDGGSSSSLAVVAAFDLPDDLNISPGLRTSFVSTGPAGGPFVPSSQTYTLGNIGDASLNWTASDNVTWLDLSVASGTIASSATTTVNATINANANVLGLGVYPAIVTFTNTVSGKTINRNVTLYVNDFATALDSPALTFETSGVSWLSQTTTTHDGVDAAQSGAMGDGQTSSLQSTLTGPGKLTFWWKVSSEANYDFLRFYIDNVEQTGSLARISGEVNWVQKTVSIPLGSHSVRWSYTKDSADIRGSDAAWLDQVVWQPLPLNTVEVSYPNGGETVFLGSAQTISWAANITGNVKIDLFKGDSFHSVLAADESNDGTYSWLVSAALPAASDYTVKVSSVNNPAYSDTSDAAFTIMPQPTLADALDTTGLTWLTSGNLPWFTQIATTKDGADAARSGAITHNQSSSVETTLTGPGQLTFWWKVSSETNWDFLRFFINGVEQSGSLVRISGEVNWVQKTVAIPAGSHVVKWSYTKDGSVNTGSDAAWLDQVVFTPTNNPEIAVEQPIGTDLIDGTASVDCGVFNLTSSSPPISFTVKNLGDGDLTGLTLSKDGGENADFTLGSLGATTLAPGASTTFTVTFAPSGEGIRNAAVHIASNDSNENPFDIALSGTGVTVGTLVVSPAAGFTTSGSYGGSFSPPSKLYTISNPGTTSIDWAAAKTAEWMDLSTSGGTLAPGDVATMTVSINDDAKSLALGTYNDTVTFTNATNGNGDTTRGVSLAVNPIPASVTLGNLSQTYDGSPKSVSVSTDPPGLDYTVTYNLSADPPTNAGTYAVVATVTTPNYSGSDAENMVISTAPQTINFAALDPVYDTQPSLVLTATATSGLTVSYTSSNPAVATVSGATVTIVGAGTTTITATQSGNVNYAAATPVPQTLTVGRFNPLSVTGGPYKVLFNQPLPLNGGGSQPSYGETITSFSWDLNNDNIFGDVTSASASISFADLTNQSLWKMVEGFNTIQLRVTDSAGKISTASTTVEIIIGLIWDANTTTIGAQDGGGSWSGNNWWDGSSNQTWTSGSSANFGNGGTGGTVTLAGPTTVNNLFFSSFSGTYTLAGPAAPTTISQNATTIGLTAGNVIFKGNSTTNKLTVAGAGGITMNGSGVLNLRENLTLTYTGATAINSGTLMVHGNKAAGNFSLNGGMLTDYFQNTTAFTSGLGIGDNQIQIYGSSGFGGGNGNSTWRIGATGSTIIWGASGEGSATGFFNPTTLKFLAPGVDNMGPTIFGQVTLDNKLDLNSLPRTIGVASATGVSALSSSWGKVDDGITGGVGSLNKTGGGNLIIAGTSDYTGGTTISQGALRFDSIASMPSSGNVQVNDGSILGVKVGGTGNWSGGTSGTGTLGGLIAGVGGAGSSTVSYLGNVGLLLDVGANTSSSATITNAGATSLALYKIGSSSLTLSGNNYYTGGTFLYAGVLGANHANALGTSGDITFRGGTLQYNASTAGVDYGSRIKNSASAITLDTNSQNVTVSGITNTNTGGLAKSGAGKLTFTGTNTYSGATTLSAGSIAVYNGSLSTSGGAVSFAANGTAISVLGGTGVRSTWDLGGQTIQTSNANLSDIQMVIDGGGVAGGALVTNVGLLVWGRTASNSGILLTNGGRMSVNGEVRIGNPYYSENGGASMTIGGVTAASIFAGDGGDDFYIGYGERTGSKNNVVTISTGGLLSSIRDMYVGHTNNAQNNDNPTTNNQLLVTGGIASMRGLTLGYIQTDTKDATANVVSVSNTGTLSTTGATYIGRANNATSTSNANTVTITGTDSSWNAGNQTVYVGHTNNATAQSNNNILTVASGGVLTNVNSLIVGFGTGTETGNQVVLNSGTITATTVTVNAGNSLSGSGTINGATTVNGTLTPGNSVGTLAFTGNLNISGLALGSGGLNFELGPLASSDKITVGGGLTIGTGTLNFSDFVFTDVGGLQNGTYVLISGATSLSGTLDSTPSSLTGPVGAGTGLLRFNGNNLELVVSGIGGGSAYDTWAMSFQPNDVSNKAGDNDNDGKNNLYEFAFDGNPLSGANDGKIVSRIATVGVEQVLTLTLPVRNGADFASDSGDQLSDLTDGIFYRIEGGTDLASFEDTISEVTGSDATIIQTALPALSSGWGYRTFRTSGTVSSATKKFIRAKASETP